MHYEKYPPKIQVKKSYQLREMSMWEKVIVDTFEWTRSLITFDQKFEPVAHVIWEIDLNEL